MVVLILQNFPGVFLVHTLPHSDRVERDTPYLSVFSSNAGKYGPGKL